MIQLIMKPTLHLVSTCEQFVQEFNVGKDDLILTNQYIYDPNFGELGLEANVIFQETYGVGEPTDIMVESIIRDTAKTGCKRVIAVGGGTVIDIAKALAVSNERASLDDLYNEMPNLTRRYELIIIPTTCGTGSEVTNIAVFNRTRMGTKMGLVSPAMYADSAVLIPELLESLPLKVFATSSIDALVHAVESCLSPNSTAYTKVFGYKAIEMIISGYRQLARDGLDTRNVLMDEFLTASNFAGLAFGTAGCGTVHAMAYPLGGQCHVAHGESNYAVFIGVMREYMRHREDGEIAVMNAFLAELLDCEVERVYDALEGLLNMVLPKKPLREYGAAESDLPVWAKSVIDNQQRLLKNSFIPMSEELVLKIYQELY